MRTNVRQATRALLLFSFAGLVACGDDTPPPKPAEPDKGESATPDAKEGETAAGDAKAAAGSPTPGAGDAAAGAAAAGEVAEIAYAYSPIGKRDPFRSLFDQLNKSEQTGTETELQKFEIDQLKLVAVVSRTATPYAMVEDPKAKGHTLTRGTLIGKNWGRVSEISEECVTVKEEYRDYTGRKVTNKLQLCLPKAPELKLD